MTRILGVHGIWNYSYFRRGGRSADTATKMISADWAGWLRDGSGGIEADMRVAYYSHHLHRGTAQGDEDAETLEQGAQELLVNWVELLRDGPQVALGAPAIPVRQATDWLTRHFGEHCRAFAVAFCREVHAYLCKPDSSRREQARRSVIDAIDEHRPAVLVAHSLGSVVAYEALFAAPPTQDIDLLITIGSPLAMPGVVFDRLRPQPDALRRGQRPPGVRRWINIADVGDIVAVPRGGLGRHFAGVHQDIVTTIALWDFHSARRYLGCASVRDAIAAAVT